jgi:hypothetical protein
VQEDPPLEPRLGDPPTHAAACHFPVADGENIADSTPEIGASERVIEEGVIGNV